MSEDEKVTLILDAAYACFARHGVRRTTMEDIAREAGMSRPSVYQYVRNKEDAFRRLAGQLLDRALAESRAAAARPADDPADRLAAALAGKLGLVQRMWQDSPAHAAELLGVDARLSAELITAYEAAMRELLADLAPAGLSRAAALELAELLLAFTRGLEADLTDPDAPARRLRQGVRLMVTGLAHSPTTSLEPS
ncbi:helix-turn-helix domain-containing protein [Kitasatospora sp. NPDC048540]|uniref:TetR/AcrR family transcriptional regulator n=1 Tax=unclassified Kitasatospora TaxID=2633591 RepID=UPI000539DCFC|nr:TetR/AcrR family transcriptional regulator [Kitasatospora sp. MBT63]